jgi:hypothetical protein
MRIFATLLLSVLCVAGIAALDIPSNEFALLAGKAKALKAGETDSMTITIAGKPVAVGLAVVGVTTSGTSTSITVAVAGDGVSATITVTALADGSMKVAVTDKGKTTYAVVSGTTVTQYETEEALLAALNQSTQDSGVQGGGSDTQSGTDLTVFTGNTGAADESITENNAGQILSKPVSESKPK